MGNYIKSNGVSIFPSSLRSGAYSKGKFTTEENLTRFLKSVTDLNSFVLAGPYTDITTENPHYNATHYIFIINGFYFEVKADLISSDSRFASIRLDADGRLLAWNGSIDLDKTDSGEDYCQALYISKEIPSTSEFTPYTLDFRAADKFAKFSTDTFYWNGVSLNDILDDKQDKFIANDPTRQLDLAGNLVKNILPIANGGTGYDNINDATIGNAKHLVSDTGAISKGDSKHSVYFLGGIPQVVNVVENANKLTNDNAVGLTVGSSSHPIYFNNGYPTITSNNLEIHAAGLNSGSGGIISDTASGTVKYTSVYFNNGGTATEGIHINISPETPGASVGNIGDLWFKYQK